MQGSPDAKKPCKGILKTSSSFDRHSGSGASYRKSAKFDELNVMQTYHPADKDYGHMKIEEPKTPYNYAEPDDTIDQLDAEVLAEKLRTASTRTSSYDDDDDDDEDSSDEIQETAEEKARRLEFEKRRKAHYNEYEAVRLARKLIEEEDDDDDDGGEENVGKSQGSSSDKQADGEHKIRRNTTENTNSSDKEMDIDVSEDAQQAAGFSEH